MGYDRLSAVSYTHLDFLLMVRPFEIVTLKRAIMTAIELGYGREVTSPADDEIDEGLA